MPPREPVFPARPHQCRPEIPGTSSSPLHCPRLCLWGCVSSSYPGSPPPPLLGGKFLSKENSSPCRENPFLLMIAHPSKRIVFVSYNQGCLFFPNSFVSSTRLVVSSVFAVWGICFGSPRSLDLEEGRNQASPYIEILLELLKGDQGPGGRLTVALHSRLRPSFIAPAHMPYF